MDAGGLPLRMREEVCRDGLECVCWTSRGTCGIAESTLPVDEAFVAAFAASSGCGLWMGKWRRSMHVPPYNTFIDITLTRPRLAVTVGGPNSPVQS